MNDRIKEIATQTDIWCDQNYPNNPLHDVIWEERFAELLVRECIDALDQIPVYYKNENDREIERNTISDCIRAIEERFGVEE